MPPGKNARRKQKASGGKRPSPPVRRPPKPPPDPNSPGARLRRFLEETLRADRGITMPALLDTANAWARQGHTHLGYALWPGDRPFGPHYLGLLLKEDWAAKLASPELRKQARFFRDNPDKDLDDLKLETRARIEALRERRARERVEQAERQKQRDAERKAQEQAEKQRKLREQQERDKHAAEEARRRRERVLEHVVAFFTAAGLEVVRVGDAVNVAGSRISPSPKQERSRQKLDELLDRFVWDHHRELLLESIRRNLRGVHELRGVEGTNGWILTRGREPIAVVRATSAKAASLPAHPGNYLDDREPSWGQLAEELAQKTHASKPPAPELPRLKRRIFRELPDGVSAELRDLALDASAQLRTERNLVFGHAVELQYGAGAVRFQPLQEDGARVEVPMTWTRWAKGAQGRIRINGTEDPLHLVFEGGDVDSAVVDGWVVALVAYAQLVCREDLAEFVRPSSQRAAPRVQAPPRRGVSRPPSGGAGLRVAGSFKPIGRTRSWIASYVVGHRRRLRPGQSASSEARIRAARVGITLRPGETWVSPHVRGIPADAVLQFRWDAPRELGWSLPAGATRNPVERMLDELSM